MSDNLQWIFDKVAAHLLIQKEKSEDFSRIDQYGKPECRYRNADGLKCAVGCLIPDELYTSIIEGAGVHVLWYYKQNPDLLIEHKQESVKALLKILEDQLGELTERNVNLLTRLQGIHDEMKESEWRNELKWVAFDYELSDEVLENGIRQN